MGGVKVKIRGRGKKARKSTDQKNRQKCENCYWEICTALWYIDKGKHCIQLLKGLSAKNIITSCTQGQMKISCKYETSVLNQQYISGFCAYKNHISLSIVMYMQSFYTSFAFILFSLSLFHFQRSWGLTDGWMVCCEPGHAFPPPSPAQRQNLNIKNWR